MKSKEEETGTERGERGGRIEGEGEVNGFRTNYAGDANRHTVKKPHRH